MTKKQSTQLNHSHIPHKHNSNSSKIKIDGKQTKKTKKIIQKNCKFFKIIIFIFLRNKWLEFMGKTNYYCKYQSQNKSTSPRNSEEIPFVESKFSQVVKNIGIPMSYILCSSPYVRKCWRSREFANLCDLEFQVCE